MLLVKSCWMLSWEFATSEPTYLEDGSSCTLISPNCSTSKSWRGSWLGGSRLGKTSTSRFANELSAFMPIQTLCLESCSFWCLSTCAPGFFC